MKQLQMTKTILLFIILCSCNNISSIDYDRVKFPNMYIFDFRYINELYRKSDFKLVENIFRNLEQEDYAASFNKFVYMDRRAILGSKFNWANINGTILANKISNMKLKDDLFPPSIIVKEFESSFSSIIPKDVFIDSLPSVDGDKSYYLHSFGDNYILEIKNSSLYNDKLLALSIIKVNKTIFNELNNKYIIGTVFVINNSSDIKFIKPEIGYELSIVYGLIESNFDLNKLDSYIVDELEISLRSDPSLADGVNILTLFEGDVVQLLEIGAYDVVNNESGNWLKVKYNENIIGWCFSSELFYNLGF